MVVKSFITSDPGVDYMEHFYSLTFWEKKARAFERSKFFRLVNLRVRPGAHLTPDFFQLLD